MFSPVGYTSIKEIEDHAKSLNIPNVTSAVFHKLLSEVLEVFAASPGGTTMKLLPGVLGVGNDGEYVFLQRKTWTVDLQRVREAARELNNLSVGQYLLTVEDEADRDPLLKNLSLEFAEALQPFEGHALVFRESDASRLTEKLEEFARNPPPPLKPKLEEMFASLEEGVAAYNQQVENWESRGQLTTPAEREKWIMLRDAISLPGSKRDRARQIRKESSEPNAWSHKGRRKKRES